METKSMKYRSFHCHAWFLEEIVSELPSFLPKSQALWGQIHVLVAARGVAELLLQRLSFWIKGGAVVAGGWSALGYWQWRVCLISCVDIHEIYWNLVFWSSLHNSDTDDKRWIFWAAHFSGTLMKGTNQENHWPGHHLIQGPPKRICISGSKWIITRVYQGQVVNGEDPWNRALNTIVQHLPIGMYIQVPYWKQTWQWTPGFIPSEAPQRNF